METNKAIAIITQVAFSAFIVFMFSKPFSSSCINTCINSYKKGANPIREKRLFSIR
ncbi:hypothetical protein HMPREF0454_04813 [Hafnia alvei ATCC 51873]|uniref:Uncharacterized protein n=1 Tax=Hafnia alvei ATCC 51873 TaxID=1002364 RepID=G9YDW5_HAFAL|nr:hypothetical protein HMPREF0454_04813 [Hafnia alvei ATCC 51873]